VPLSYLSLGPWSYVSSWFDSLQNDGCHGFALISLIEEERTEHCILCSHLHTSHATAGYRAICVRGFPGARHFKGVIVGELDESGSIRQIRMKYLLW
jgi:hypothetical protein